jgi:hypothetical protein
VSAGSLLDESGASAIGPNPTLGRDEEKCVEATDELGKREERLTFRTFYFLVGERVREPEPRMAFRTGGDVHSWATPPQCLSVEYWMWRRLYIKL